MSWSAGEVSGIEQSVQVTTTVSMLALGSDRNSTLRRRAATLLRAIRWSSRLGSTPHLRRVERQIQTGADADLKHVAAGVRNPGGAEASGVLVPHAQVDEERPDVFGVETHQDEGFDLTGNL